MSVLLGAVIAIVVTINLVWFIGWCWTKPEGFQKCRMCSKYHNAHDHETFENWDKEHGG